MIAPSPPKIHLPLVFSIVAAILGIVVLATPGLMEENNSSTKMLIGPFRICVSNSMIDDCSSIDTSCKATFNVQGQTVSGTFFNKSSSCAELNWMRGLFMIAFLTGIASTLLAIISRFTIRLQLTSAIVFSIISAITSVIAMSLAIAIFVGEVVAVKDTSYITVTFTYGSTMIIVFTVLHFCAAVAYHRAKRLAFLNHALTQPLVATTTVYAPTPSYATVAVPVAQPQYQPQPQPQYQPMEGQSTYYTQQTFAYPQQSQQPQQL